MTRKLKNGLFQNAALKIVKRVNRMMCIWQSWRQRKLIQAKNFRQGLPFAKRILVLAPHMDDEMIGCAGLISHYQRLGARIVCVYLTDSAIDQTGIERLSCMATRMRETKAAGRALGIQQTYFLNQPDGRLRENPSLIEKLKAILEKEKPQLLLMPYPRDPHPDHRAIASLAAKAMPISGAGGIAPYFFQLRAPIPMEEIDLVLDISDFLESKRVLLKGYRSQPQFIFDLSLHLQSCQGVLLGRACRAAEVFAAAPLYRLAPTAGDVTDTRRQVKRHLHVGYNALRWRGSTKPEKVPAHSTLDEGLPCS